MTTITPADTLRAGAALIREKGHARGILRDEEGRYCLYGALIVASKRQAVSALKIADAFVSEVLGYPRSWPAITWNNDEAKDGTEVAEVMEKAAAWWEERQ